MAVRTPLPFPKHRSRGIRSPIVHTLALTEAALTFACGRTTDRRNSLRRFKADSDHLREEIVLLREEPRIKDARMGRIAAHRRPHCAGAGWGQVSH